jgi:hypothetical protein
MIPAYGGNDSWAKNIREVLRRVRLNQTLFNSIRTQAGKLKATTIQEIDAEYAKIKPQTSLLATCTVVGPDIDAKYALNSKLANDSIVQVASQFNFLESPSEAYSLIDNYPSDRTQGPASSMASLESLILRNAAIMPMWAYDGDKEFSELDTITLERGYNKFNHCKQFPADCGAGSLNPHPIKILDKQWIIDFNHDTIKITQADGTMKNIIRKPHVFTLGEQPIFKDITWYKNGYLEPWKAKEQDLSEKLERIKNDIGTLKILAQESRPEFGKGLCTQVFSAAPSYQGAVIPQANSPGDELCEVLVVEQYKAIAKLAVIKSISDPSKRVNLHLTSVGQSAFKNNPRLYPIFMKAAWDIVKPFNVDMFVHAYTDEKPALDILKKADIGIAEVIMKAQQFYNYS